MPTGFNENTGKCRAGGLQMGLVKQQENERLHVATNTSKVEGTTEVVPAHTSVP